MTYTLLSCLALPGQMNIFTIPRFDPKAYAHPIEPTFMHVMDTHTSMSYHRTIMAYHHTFVAYLSCKSVVINPSSIVKIQ